MSEPITPPNVSSVSAPKPSPASERFIEARPRQTVAAPQFLNETELAAEPKPEPLKTAAPTTPGDAATEPLPAGSKRALRQQAKMADQQRPTPSRYPLVTTLSAVRSLIVVFGAAVIVATIFASFTSNDSLSLRAQQNLAIAYSTQARAASIPTAVPTSPRANRIGFIRGHSGIAQRGPSKGGPDPGAVCLDDKTLTELSVTTAVGDRVIAELRGRGYTVDALDEWDMRLVDPNLPYEAAVLLSIHADSCENFDDGYEHTGFKLAGPEGRQTVRDQDLRLADCLRDHYGRVTGMKYSEYTVTNAMLYYHAFREVTQRTPAAILELGFLYYDREILTKRQDLLTRGIVDGLLCFLDPKALVKPTAQPAANNGGSNNENASIKPTTATPVQAVVVPKR